MTLMSMTSSWILIGVGVIIPLPVLCLHLDFIDAFMFYDMCIHVIHVHVVVLIVAVLYARVVDTMCSVMSSICFRITSICLASHVTP